MTWHAGFANFIAFSSANKFGTAFLLLFPLPPPLSHPPPWLNGGLTAQGISPQTRQHPSPRQHPPSIKASGAPKPDIEAAVQSLNASKLEKSSIESQLQSALSASGLANRDAFRQAVVNTLERRLFYIPSFKIYRGVAGLYDYGPPGCAVKSNVLALWRQVTFFPNCLLTTSICLCLCFLFGLFVL